MKGYEIDFIGVSDSNQDADAISIRLFDGNGNERIVIYDGGFQTHVDAMEKLLNKYYFLNKRGKIIDSVICSHPDQDHVSGVLDILDRFEVKKLYMNRPWLFAQELLDCGQKSGITLNGLIRKLKEEYKYIAKLENVAAEKNIKIYEAFQGCTIEDDLVVMSPTRELYIGLLAESDKAPVRLENVPILNCSSLLDTIKKYTDKVKENWTTEYLREDVSTTPENEMSVVVFGDVIDRPFLLTGDAGVKALQTAANYFSRCRGCEIGDCVQLYQIPHHGSRHNITPSILNRLVGKIILSDPRYKKTAVASVAEGSDHPLKMVVNAFIRRGCEVYRTGGQTICSSCNAECREGWGTVKKLEFTEMVEAWTEN